MTEWFSIFLQAVTDEWKDQPLIAAMATADADGSPHVRNVVCRLYGDQFFITTDSRSEKSKHIQSLALCELAFWLPRRREQFRIMAIAEIDSVDEQVWQDLSDQTRATFYWPPPGQPLQPDQIPPKNRPSRSPPATFQLISIKPEQVDHLELQPNPHRRRRWRLHTNWQLENLNP